MTQDPLHIIYNKCSNKQAHVILESEQINLNSMNSIECYNNIIPGGDEG